MKLLDLYSSVLSALGHRVTKDGMVDVVDVDENGRVQHMPALIDGLRLILPTSENMRKPDSGDTVSFHPMWEDVLKGPSVVIEYIRKRIMTTLGDEIATMALKLLMLITTKEEHAKLNPEQSEILDNAKKADEETVKRFIRIIKATKPFDREFSFIHVYLRRGGKVDGSTYRQASVVTFPLWEALKENPKKVFGVPLRNADHEAITDVLKFLLPMIDGDSTYSFGSNSDVAPKFEALAGSFQKVLGDLLSIDRLLKQDKGDIAAYGSDREYVTDWTIFINDTGSYLSEVRMIPKQRGNEGANDVHKEGFNQVDHSYNPTQTTPPRSMGVETKPHSSNSEKSEEESIVEIKAPKVHVPAPAHSPAHNHSNVDVGSAIRGSLAMRQMPVNPMGPATGMQGSYPIPMNPVIQPGQIPGYPAPMYQNHGFVPHGFPQAQSGLQFVQNPNQAPHGMPVQNPTYQFGNNVPFQYYGR